MDRSSKRLLFCGLCLLATASALVAGSGMLYTGIGGMPTRDNSLYEESGTLSNGAGTHLFAGATSFGFARRALIGFALPFDLGAVSVTSVTVELTCTLSPPGASAQTFALHRVTADWGQSTSDAGEPGGVGASAATGDATWTERLFGQGAPWTNPGGDFVATPSATATVGACNAATPQTVTFSSTPQLVADVQGWVDDGSTNFGWIVVGNEADVATARRFESLEAAAGRPAMTFEIEEPPVTTPATRGWGALVLTLGLLASATVILLRQRRLPC